MNNFSQFNEEFLGIDLKKIKDAAYEFHTKKECVIFMSKIDNDLANDLVKEVSSLKEKWGSIDNLAKKLLKKSESQNEGIVGMSILTIFGIHAFIKLINNIRRKNTILHYIPSLFHNTNPRDDNGKIKTVRDSIISTIFLIYLMAFIVSSIALYSDIYKDNNGNTINLPFRWHGVNNYYVY